MNGGDAPKNPPKLFISYAHADAPRLDELHRHLQPYLMKERIAQWTDREIPAGSDWRQEIVDALKSADAGILLVSSSFLASRFIHEVELPELLNRAFWVNVSDCRWDEAEFAPSQALREPSLPLNRLSAPHRETAWKEICQRLVERLEALAARTVTVGPKEPRPVAGPHLCGVPQQNRVFTGRNEELAEIAKLFRIGGANPHVEEAVRTVALRGLGGIGKSSTAIEFAHRHAKDFDYIFWVVAERPADLAPNLAELMRLHVQGLYGLDEANPAAAMSQCLPDTSSWLLIVDNAEDMRSWDGVLPNHPQCRTIVTTREILPTTMGETIEVGKLGAELAVQFLLDRAGIRDSASATDRENAAKINEMFDGHALALDQAGAYMDDHYCSPEAYLDDLRAKGFSIHADYRNLLHGPVEVTFEMSLNRLGGEKEVGPAGVELVRLCAFLGPEPIPEKVFTGGLTGSGGDLERFASNSADLRRVSSAALNRGLLAIVRQPPSISIHPLVAAVLRSSLEPNERREVGERAVNALSATFPEPDYAAWSLCARLIPHAQACGAVIEEFDLQAEPAALLLNRAGSYLRDQARFPEGERLLRNALKVCEAIYDAGNVEIARAKRALALLVESATDPIEAERLFKEANESDVHAGRSSSLEHAIGVEQLADCFYRQQRYLEAEGLFYQAGAIKQELLPPGDVGFAVSAGLHASILLQLKRTAEAVELRQEEVRIRHAANKDIHPEIAGSYEGLGIAYMYDDMLAEANAPLLKSLEYRRVIFGADHPECANALYWLATLRQKEANLPEALSLMEQSLDIQTRWLGPHHGNTLIVKDRVSKIKEALSVRPS